MHNFNSTSFSKREFCATLIYENVNPLLKLIYRFIQGLVWVSYALYFRRIVFINQERMKARGPLLVISNHPNTLIDPLMALYRMREQCFLLANYSLFKNPISNAILSTLYCIPIQRMNDVPDGQPLRNEEAFRQCNEHLLGGGSIYIAVEGTSFPERRVRDLKTGMARIAFSAEMQTDFKLDLRILPIVITYFDSLKFWKDVVVEIGEPISVDSWRTAYNQNPRKAIGDFTQSVENQMITHTIQCANAKEDRFLKKLEAILQSENYLETEKHYERSKYILNKIHAWQKEDLSSFEKFKSDVDNYFLKLKALNINDLNKNNFSKTASLLPRSTRSDNPNGIILKLLLGLPIFIYGFINNIIPACLSNGMVKWLKIDKSYDTTIRYMSGLVFFPIFWGLQKWGLSHILPFSVNGWIYLLTVIPAGLAAYVLYTEGVRFYHFLKFRNADKDNSLTQIRQPIVDKINNLINV